MELESAASAEEIESFIKRIRDRLKRAEIKRSELSGQITQIEESIQDQLKNLKEKYGLDSIDAAKREAAKLRSEVIAGANELKTLLDKAEGLLDDND